MLDASRFIQDGVGQRDLKTKFVTAGAGDVLASKKIVNASGQLITGTMPNKVGSGTVIIPSTVDQAIPKGYYGGSLADGKFKSLALEAGENLVAASDASFRKNNQPLARVKEIIVGGSGIVRVRFEIESDYAAYPGCAQVYKNDVAVGIVRTSIGDHQWVTYTEDFSVASGDKIQLYMWVPGAGVITTQNFRIYVAIPYPTFKIIL